MSNNNDNMKQQMAIQSANTYKGKVCCYASVTKKEYKEGEPALAMSDTSNVCINIFDAGSSKGVKFYFGGTLPSYIFEKTKLCMAMKLFSTLFVNKKSGNADANSPAYTSKFKFGSFKGKSPAEVLLTNPQNYNSLVQEYNKLASTTDPKFVAANTAMMAAIQDAVNLYNAGKLNANNVNSSQKVLILEETRTPNIAKLDNRGYTEARTAKITFDTDPDNKAPYCIEIMNCMAPPVQNAQIGAKLSQAVDKTMLMMNFSEEEWYGFWKDTTDAKDSFGRMLEGERLEYSEKNKWKPQQTQQKNNNYQQPNQMFGPQDPVVQYPNGYYGNGYMAQ